MGMTVYRYNMTGPIWFARCLGLVIVVCWIQNWPLPWFLRVFVLTMCAYELSVWWKSRKSLRY